MTQPKKFNLNKKFQALPVEEGDEFFANGIFEFNITKLLAHVSSNPELFPVESISVKEHAIWDKENLDEKAIGTANLENPILLVEISPGRFNVIDGNHRLEKAKRLGHEIIPAFRITAEHHQVFLTSTKAYETYINYWNEKVEDWEPADAL